MLGDILTSISKILSDGYKVQFEEHYGFLIVFPPHIYELLRRFSPMMADYASVPSFKRPNMDFKGTLSASNQLMQPQSMIKKPTGVSGGSGATTVKKPGG